MMVRAVLEFLAKMTKLWFLGFISLLMDGFVLMQLWKWFIVTAFGVAALSYPAALGITLFLSFVSEQFIPTEMDEDKRWSYYKIYVFYKPIGVLAFGWIIYNNILT